MRTRTKVWLIIAASLVLIGSIVFGGVMSVLKWDFTKLSTVKYENNDYKIHDDYQHISIITDTADIVFVPCESPTTSVSCYEQKNNMHSVSVKDGTLEIEIVDTRKWYEYIGINFGTPKRTVFTIIPFWSIMKRKAGMKPLPLVLASCSPASTLHTALRRSRNSCGIWAADK